MLRIAMDSAGDMPPEWAQEYEIETIPINIHFGEKTYLQGVDLSNSEFYELVNRFKLIPKTSQPSPHQFVEFYERIAQQGETILSIHVTSKLSGTYNSALAAAKELVGKFHVIPIDSKAGSALQGYMCREARIMDRFGASVDEVVERMKDISDHVAIFFALDTLEYARMSGRVKALQAALASILNVKPIIVLKDGILELGDRVRTRQRSLNHILSKMRDRVGDQLVNAAVVHAEDSDAGQKLLEMVRNTLNCKDLILTELSTGIAANLGPGTIGIITYPVDNG